MAARKDRLKKLLAVQEQLKALHETRHAGFVAAAAAARAEASDIAQRFDAGDSLAALFPEIYNRRIGSALARGEQAERDAQAEQARVATATLRANRVERAWREARRQDEREQGDRERLDLIGQLLPRQR